MSQTEHRCRLAVRLSLIISRLLAGETLSVKTLAVEFASRYAPCAAIFVSG